MDTRSIEVLLSTATSTALSAPVIRKWLRRQQNFDYPNERSSHTVPTPRGGGLACAVGGTLGSLTALAAGRAPSSSWMGASAFLAGVGRIDDVNGLSAIPRLGAQAVSGAYVGGKSGGPIGLISGLLVVPAIVNAYNFMDGINGISGGTAAAWGLCVAIDIAQPEHVRTQGYLSAGMGLGFLPFNVPDASMFLGDVGSYLIGAGIAVSVVESAFPDKRLRPFAAARTIAPLVPYLADTGSTILRRLARGESLTAAHREHSYQRLAHETGWDHWKVSLLASFAAGACGLAARSRTGSLAVVPIAGLYLFAPDIARTLIAYNRERV